MVGHWATDLEVSIGEGSNSSNDDFHNSVSGMIFWLSSRNFFEGGKIYCYANFFCYDNFSIVFGLNFKGQKSPRGELSQGAPPLWKKATF